MVALEHDIEHAAEIELVLADIVAAQSPNPMIAAFFISGLVQNPAPCDTRLLIDRARGGAQQSLEDL